MLGFADGLMRSEGAGLVALDLDLRFIFWNATMERISGLTASDVIGRRTVEVFSFLGEQDEHLRRALSGETVAIQRRRYTLADRESDGFLDGYFTPFTNDEGEIV